MLSKSYPKTFATSETSDTPGVHPGGGRCKSDRGAPIGLTIAKESAADVLFISELEEQTDKHTSTAIDLFRSGGV